MHTRETLSTYERWYGADRPAPEVRALHAGPVSALLDGVDIRYVRLGSQEAVRRIYVAVRDQNWNTIPGQYQITRLEQETDHFLVEFEMRHQLREIDFRWQGRIIGSPDGRIRYEMDGEALSDFRYNRIGFCVLHPINECAGQPYIAQTPEGELRGRLPREIGAQGYAQGLYVPLFPSFSHLTIDLAGGGQADMRFEGDLFEMEDQRNWTDASLKTYCTPLSRGFPYEAHPGTRISQSFTLAVQGTQQTAQADNTPRLTLGKNTLRHLPTIGFGLNSDGVPLSEQEIAYLRLLRPDHLRVSLSLTRDERARCEQAIAACHALDCALEIALYLPLSGDIEAGLVRLASQLHGRVRVARFLILHEGGRSSQPSETTAPERVTLARRALQAAAPQALFAGGTDMYFCELNRTRPRVEAMDALTYTIVPQVHAFDERSLVETLEAQAETVKSVQAFAQGRPVVVSPITLKRRFNPNATTAEVEASANELPDAVDPRQMSLFGAGWSAGSVKYLSESGAASLTYFETTGWLGLLEREGGAPLPTQFPSVPGMLFPLYYVFADLAEWRAGRIVACQSNQPLTVAGLALERGGTLHLLVVNYTEHEQRVEIGPIASSQQAALRSLDAQSMQLAALDAPRFRQQRVQLPLEHDTLVLTLAPYATVRVDIQ